MEIVKLSRFNEWWETGHVRESLLGSHKRPLFFKILDYIGNRQMVLLTGLRRVGKTTLMYQLIQHLLEKKVGVEEIVYFSFDEEIEDFDELIKTYEEKVLKKKIESERTYIFLDEIQKCKNWENKIKIYYDLYPNVKFIISGSASIQISRKAKETLAGRIFDFLLEPLPFEEFLAWKGLKVDKNKIELYQHRIMPYFHDYLRKGGFPEIIDEKSDEKIKNYIKNNIIERIVYKDLPQEFGIKDHELLKTLLEIIATQPGVLINYDALSRALKKNKRTIIDYLFYLEYALLINVLANYREGFVVSSRKLKKAYLNNTSISFCLVEHFYSDGFMEKIAENFAIIETNAKNYYRNTYEIDIILGKGKKILPLEVKYGKIENMEIRPIKDFLSEFKLRKALILTKDFFGKKIFNQKKVFFIPLWAFALVKEEYL